MISLYKPIKTNGIFKIKSSQIEVIYTTWCKKFIIRVQFSLFNRYILTVSI